ncbi:hypothetical protein C8R45DRAFT_928691 [Mycena sanguinolenta]|nr:hypothetical protein C8R45DRAFT_928691 [Mycena sanguinolenta]
MLVLSPSSVGFGGDAALLAAHAAEAAAASALVNRDIARRKNMKQFTIAKVRRLLRMRHPKDTSAWKAKRTEGSPTRVDRGYTDMFAYLGQHQHCHISVQHDLRVVSVIPALSEHYHVKITIICATEVGVPTKTKTKIRRLMAAGLLDTEASWKSQDKRHPLVVYEASFGTKKAYDSCKDAPGTYRQSKREERRQHDDDLDSGHLEPVGQGMTLQYDFTSPQTTRSVLVLALRPGIPLLSTFGLEFLAHSDCVPVMQYLRPIPRIKPLGSALTSVFVSTFAMILVLWTIFSVIAGALAGACTGMNESTIRKASSELENGIAVMEVDTNGIALERMKFLLRKRGLREDEDGNQVEGDGFSVSCDWTNLESSQARRNAADSAIPYHDQLHAGMPGALRAWSVSFGTYSEAASNTRGAIKWLTGIVRHWLMVVATCVRWFLAESTGNQRLRRAPADSTGPYWILSLTVSTGFCRTIPH